MAADGGEAPIRFGYLPTTSSKPADAVKAGEKPKTDARDSGKGGETKDGKEKKEPARVGWSALPPGTEMHLRMSGLLWPEATHRLANSAYVTRESSGHGQIILFATGPTFRDATLGPARVMLNAMI